MMGKEMRIENAETVVVGRNRRGWLAVFLVSVLLLVSTLDAQDRKTAREVKGMRMPLEYYENGAIKSQILAKRATIPEEDQDDIYAWGVRAEFFDQSDNLEILITGGNCTYNRAKGIVASKDKVKVEKSDAMISGVGFKWDSKNQRIKIMDKTRVVLSKGLNIGDELRQRKNK